MDLRERQSSRRSSEPQIEGDPLAGTRTYEAVS